MISVKVPDVGVIRFPDDTPDEVIDREVRNAHTENQLQTERASFQKPLTPQSLATFATKAIDIEQPILGRISLGGLGRIAGAVATDILTQPSQDMLRVPSMRATAAELMGEPTPPDIQEQVDRSPVRRGIVGAAKMVPTVGAGMLLPGSSFLTTPLAFGAEGFERAGSEGDIAAGAIEAGKQAAIGAALPVLGTAGRLAGGAATAALVNRGIGGAVLANPAVQKAIEFGTSQAAVQLPLIAHLMSSDEYKNATPAQKRDMLIETTVSLSAFGLPEVVHAVRAPRSAASMFENMPVRVARELSEYQPPVEMPLQLDAPAGTTLGIGAPVRPEAPLVQPWPTPENQVGEPRPETQVLPGGTVLPGDSLVARPRVGQPEFIDPEGPAVIPVQRNIRQDPGGGQVSFSAEAPTLLRNAPEVPVTPETEAPQEPQPTPTETSTAGAESTAPATSQPKEPNAIPQQSANEVGVQNEPAVGEGVAGENQPPGTPSGTRQETEGTGKKKTLVDVEDHDAIEAWLEKKIAEQPDSGPGVAYSMPMFSPTIYLRAALSMYRTGKTIAQSIDEAVEMAKRSGLTAAEEPRFRALMSAGMPSISPAPPLPPSALPPGVGAPATPRPLKTLDDAREHFKPGKKERKPLGEVPSDLWNKFVEGTVQEYRPLTVLEDKIFKALGINRPYTQDFASAAESLAGARGQARGDIIEFDRQLKPYLKGVERDDFNSYLLANRVIDRNNTQGRTGKSRQTGDWTNADAENVISILKQKYGNKYKDLEQAGVLYNAHMDQALNRMVTSGRMSQETYDEIKDANAFYAPYRVMKYLTERETAKGAGRQIDTQAELTKMIRGMSDKDFKLDDMMAAGRAQIARARILSEKSLRMQRFHGLSAADPTGQFIRKVEADHKPGEGKDVVVAMENGEPIHYEVDQRVAEAVKGMNKSEGDVLLGVLRGLNKPFKMGATAFSMGFQMVNAPLDQARMATMSKVGVGNAGITDIYRYIPDLFHGAWESAVGNRLLPRLKSQKHQEFLASGASGSNPIAQFDAPLSEGATKTPGPVKKVLGDTAGYISRVGQAIEEATKMAGFIRALRIAGVNTGEDLLRLRPDLVTEVRRYAGSPDFSRAGKWVRRYHLNDIFAFSNARIQGQMDDIARLFNAKEPKAATAAAARLSVLIGIPTATLWAVNHSPSVKDDYDKIAAREKDDYFHYPKTNADGSPRYITNAKGDKVRDWWRFPKKDIVQHFANMVESGLDSYAGTDPKGTRSFITSTIENASPLNITGKDTRERMESVIASTGPLQSLYIIASGRNAYTHRDVVASEMKRRGSPEKQVNPGTPDLYKRIAEAMPKWAPDFARSPLMVENLTKNMSANLIDQFVPRTGIKGRSGAEEWRIFRRFQGSGYEDNPEFREKMDELHRKAADESIDRDNAVNAIFEKNPDTGDAIRAAIKQFGAAKDRKGLDRFRELLRARSVGTSEEDRQLLGLPPRQRAEYIWGQTSKMDQGATLSYLRQLRTRKVLSDDTVREMKMIQMKVNPGGTANR